MSQHYDPSRYFKVRSIDEAKAVILTEEGATTEQRWLAETPYLGGLISDYLAIHRHHRLLDYGCGIGRMAKEMISRTGCSVVGADISTVMRALAPMYVDSSRFFACAPEALAEVGGFHFAIAVWTLQHVPQLARTVAEIKARLLPSGRLLVVNTSHRCLPFGDAAWGDDGEDVREQLCSQMNEVIHGNLDPKATTQRTADNSWWAIYQRRN